MAVIIYRHDKDVYSATFIDGDTIFISSHMFEEVEKTCDRVAIIKQGKIVIEVLMKEIEHKAEKTFEIVRI